VEYTAVVAIVGIVATALTSFIVHARERREANAAHCAQVERLERLLAAKTLGEAAAVERAFAGGPPEAPRPPAAPDEIDEMFADPPRRKGRNG
jgi:type II secretory pathway pseudopilin PulG